MTINPTNPFDREDADYLVLANHEEQHSLWPAHLTVPGGWTVVYGADNRAACIDYVERHWLDITPKSRRMPVLQVDRELGEAV